MCFVTGTRPHLRSVQKNVDWWNWVVSSQPEFSNVKNFQVEVLRSTCDSVWWIVYLQVGKDFLLSGESSRPPGILGIVYQFWRAFFISICYVMPELLKNLDCMYTHIRHKYWDSYRLLAGFLAAGTFWGIRSNWPTLWKAKSQIWNIFTPSKAIKQIRHCPAGTVQKF